MAGSAIWGSRGLGRSMHCSLPTQLSATNSVIGSAKASSVHPGLSQSWDNWAVTHLNMGKSTAKKNSELLMSAPILGLICSTGNDRITQVMERPDQGPPAAWGAVSIRRSGLERAVASAGGLQGVHVGGLDKRRGTTGQPGGISANTPHPAAMLRPERGALPAPRHTDVS